MLGCALAAPSALASSAGLSGTTLVVAAGSEEENFLEINRSGDSFVIFEDSLAGVQAGSGCRQAGDALEQDPNQVICPATGIQRATIDTGDRDDFVLLLATVPALIDGGPGNDDLAGGGAGDTLRGGTGRDTVRGGLGDDVVDGGPDVDEGIEGEDGDDTVISRDGVFEEAITCGVGEDSLIADRTDEASQDCERRVESCFGRPGPRVTVRNGRVRARGSAVRLRVVCASPPCRGRVALTTSRRIRGRRVGLGRRAFATRRDLTLGVPLSRRARRLLAQRRRLRVRATVVGTGQACAGRRTVTRFTLLAPAR